MQGREEHRNIYELLVPPEPEKGLCSLPAPSPGDIFLDFEGDQFTFEGGLEYLFGVLTIAEDDGRIVYEPTWAMNPAEEKRAFRKIHANGHRSVAGSIRTCTSIITALTKKRRSSAWPDSIRPAWMKLMNSCAARFGGYVPRGQAGLRASVESYSIKKLEPFYEYRRDVKLIDANRALQAFQTVLAFGAEEENLDDIRTAIEGYNRDDCVSALRLRDWLERLRKELEQQVGAPLPRPEPKRLNHQRI